MPTGEPVPIQMMPVQINVPTTHLFVSMSIQADGTPESALAMETAPQELVDLLQTWPGRLADVTAQVYGTTLATVTPTNPDPLPDPPQDPPTE